MDAYYQSSTTCISAAKAPFKLVVSIHKTLFSPSTEHQKAGPTLLFAHANGFFKEIWYPLLIRLCRAGFQGTCITYDVRNQGDSGLINNPIQHQVEGYSMTMTDNTEDVMAVIRGLGLKGPLIGIGHSMGGMALMKTELHHPGTFQRIVAIDPTIYVESQARLKEDEVVHGFIAFAMKKPSRWSSRDEAWDALRKHPYYANWHPEMLATFVQHGLISDPNRKGVELKSSAAEECSIYRHHQHQATNMSKEVKDLRLPIHYLCGRRSRMIPMAMAVHTAMNTKNSELMIMAKGTHMVLMEEIDRIAAEISRILHHAQAQPQSHSPAFSSMLAHL